jgi:hypothetical protein
MATINGSQQPFLFLFIYGGPLIIPRGGWWWPLLVASATWGVGYVWHNSDSMLDKGFS